MSREHAPAVRDLAARLVSKLIRYGLVPAIDRPMADGLAADSIAEGLEQFIKKVTVVKQVLTDTEGYLFGAQAMADELARWEPPKPEAK